MISENNKKFLRKISFLANFSDEELNDFFEHLEAPITLPEGNALITDGAIDRNLYIILSGEFSIFKKHGLKKSFVAKVKKTEVIGEISEYVGEKRTASVIVSTPEARVLRVNVKKYPTDMRLKIRENYCNILAKRLIKKNDELHELKEKMTDVVSSVEEKAYKAETALKEEIQKLNEIIAEQERTIKTLRASSHQ